MKKCPAPGWRHLRAAIHRVGILTVFLAAKISCSRRRCCRRKNVSSQQFRLNCRRAIRETAKLRFHAVWVPLQHRLHVRLRSRHRGSQRRTTQWPWRRRVSRTGPRVRKKACLDTPWDCGSHVCCRVRVSASVSVSVSCVRACVCVSASVCVCVCGRRLPPTSSMSSYPETNA